MGRVESLDASGLVKPGRRLEQQDSMKAMKETQYALKWLGRSSSDRYGVEATDVDTTRQQSQKTDIGHRSENLNSIVKPKELPSLRTRAQHIPRKQLPETCGTAGKVSDQNSKKNEDVSFELFKKEFVAKLAEKAKERPGYLQANEDFSKPVKAQHKLFKLSDGNIIKPVKECSKPSNQSDELFGELLKAPPMPFNPTESLDQPSSLVVSRKSRKDILERTVKIIESSKTILRNSSLEKRKSSPPNYEKSTSPSWMSKYDKLNVDHNKRPWPSAKDIEETSKDFILNKFFQSPSRRPSGSVDDVYAADGESDTPRAFSLRSRIVRTEQNASPKTECFRQGLSTTLDEKQNLGQMTAESEKFREGKSAKSGELLPDRVAQIRREMSRTEFGSPGRRSSSEDRRKDSSRSPRRKSSSEDTRKDSSTRSIGGGLSADDRRIRDHETTRVRDESQTPTNQPELKAGMSPDNELQQQSVKREKEAMLKKLKKAAAVDQAHFLRALQDNGTVQSSSPISKDMGYSEASDATPQRPSSPIRMKSSALRPSSPNRLKISDNLNEVRGNSRVDVPLRDLLNEEREAQSREPSPKGRREPPSFGSSTRSREPSPTGRREPYGSSTRSREPSPTGRREAASYGSSGSTIPGRGVSQRRSHKLDMDSSSEKTSPTSDGEIRSKASRDPSQLPSGLDSPSCASPRLSHQSSFRSTGTDENESVSGGSVIERLMRKVSLRSSLSNTENQTNSSSVPASPIHRSVPSPTSDLKSLRRTLSFDSNKDIRSRSQPEFPQEIRASTPRSGGDHRSSGDTHSSTEQHRFLSERKSAISQVTSVLEHSTGAAPAELHPLSNSLRVNVQVKESTIAKMKSRSSTSAVITESQNVVTVKTIEELCIPIATPERTTSPVLSGGSWSPGSDDSSSEASGIEQPSPVSVLSYNNKRTPFQEDNRLSPLEHKIQVLHERIRKSKIDVTNQKKARLEKIKAREIELKLCVVTQLRIDESLQVIEEVPPVVKAPQLLLLPFAYDAEEKKSLASVIAVSRDEKLVKARTAGPILDFCTSLETLDLKSISKWARDKKWDLVYIRDVLLVSNFGRDKSTMTKWHSVTEPMDPCLFDDLEEFYKIGKKFPGSQFLSSLAVSQEYRPRVSMQDYVQRIFLNPATRHRATVDSMNRCHLFDVVNETLAKKLVPYIALPRPWMRNLAKPVVRPRPTGSALMQEICADILDQTGNNGSMSMDKAQLHQSLEDLISDDLFKRTDLFPCREIERSAERVGIELERRILDDLLQETIASLANFT